MKISIVVMAMALATAAVVAGCGQSAPTTPTARPEPIVASPSARPEDEQLLDGLRLGWLAAAQAWYDAGKTDLSFMQLQLQRIDEARRSLRALEAERRRFLAAGELQYLSGNYDPFALNHALQMIDYWRVEVLASVGAAVE